MAIIFTADFSGICMTEYCKKDLKVVCPYVLCMMQLILLAQNKAK